LVPPVDAGQPVLEMIAQAAALTSAGLRLAALTDLPQAGKAQALTTLGVHRPVQIADVSANGDVRK
jgi:hypothetical protein